MPEYTVPCQGIVAYSEREWKWEDMLTREPDDDEFLVEMIATGLCHTDISGYGAWILFSSRVVPYCARSYGD